MPLLNTDCTFSCEHEPCNCSVGHAAALRLPVILLVCAAATTDLQAGLEYNNGIEALRARSISQALEWFRMAEENGHDPVDCAAQRWFCWMLAGDFERAWQESDRITVCGNPDPHRCWDGRPFDGKRVIVRCLHGFGDAIQFVRYAQPLSQVAAKVIV